MFAVLGAGWREEEGALSCYEPGRSWAVVEIRLKAVRSTYDSLRVSKILLFF